MDSTEYKKIINQRNILGYATLVMTLKELKIQNRSNLAIEIIRILKYNQVEKPDLHLKPDEQETNFYQVDFSFDQVEEIRDFFLDLEASFVSEKGDTTPLASFNASLCDKWNRLIDTTEN